MNDHPDLDVFVVEDEFLIRWAVSRTLASAGHHVREASDAASAIASLSGQSLPDVALIDYRLPDTCGLDLLKMLRTLAPDMAIVMMTADRTPEMANVAHMGVHDVLQKPFEMDQVEPALLDAHRAHAPAMTQENARSTHSSD